jgi:hypothetical protein
MHGPGFISIWFFIGVLLTVYGVIITATGLYELGNPPANPPVLASLHTSIWWGLGLLAIGLFYLVRFLPKRP